MKTNYGESQKPRGQKWFIRLCLLFGGLYFLLMVGVTVYAQTVYMQQLPTVGLDNPREAEIAYTLREQAEITEDGTVILLDLSKIMFPTRVLEPGCPVTLRAEGLTLPGTLKQVTEHPDYLYELTLDLDPSGLPPGTKGEAEMICTPAAFQNTVPRSQIMQNMDGRDVIYLVVQQDGPWGKQYVLQEEEVSFWPREGSDTVALMLMSELAYPIAIPGDPEQFLYTGMEVQLTG